MNNSQPLTRSAVAAAIREQTHGEVKRLLDEEAQRVAAVTADQQTLRETETMSKPKTQADFEKVAAKRRETKRQHLEKQRQLVREIKQLRRKLVTPKEKHVRTVFGTVSVATLSRKQKALRRELRSKVKELRKTKLEPTSKQDIERHRKQLSSAKHVLVPTYMGSVSLKVRSDKDKETLEKIDMKQEQLAARKNELLSQFQLSTVGRGMTMVLAMVLVALAVGCSEQKEIAGVLTLYKYENEEPPSEMEVRVNVPNPRNPVVLAYHLGDDAANSRVKVMAKDRVLADLPLDGINREGVITVNPVGNAVLDIELTSSPRMRAFMIPRSISGAVHRKPVADAPKDRTIRLAFFQKGKDDPPVNVAPSKSAELNKLKVMAEIDSKEPDFESS